MRELLVQYRGKRSQREMAEKYGVSQQLWALWELGKSAPRPHVMKQISLDAKKPMEKIFFDVFNQQN